MSFRRKKIGDLQKFWTIPFDVPRGIIAPKAWDIKSLQPPDIPFAFLGIRNRFPDLGLTEQNEEHILIMLETCINAFLVKKFYALKNTYLDRTCHRSTDENMFQKLSEAKEMITRAKNILEYDVVTLEEAEDRKKEDRYDQDEENTRITTEIAMDDMLFRDILCLIDSMIFSISSFDAERLSFTSKNNVKGLMANIFDPNVSRHVVQGLSVKYRADSTMWKGSLEFLDIEQVNYLWEVLQDKAMILRDNVVSLMITNPLVDNTTHGNDLATPCFRYHFGTWEEEQVEGGQLMNVLSFRKENVENALTLEDFLKKKIERLETFSGGDFVRMARKFVRTLHVIYYQIFGSLAIAEKAHPGFNHGNLDPRSAITITVLKKPRLLELTFGKGKDAKIHITTRYVVKIGDFYDAHFTLGDMTTELDAFMNQNVPPFLHTLFRASMMSGERVGLGPSPRYSQGIGDQFSIFRPTNARPNKSTFVEDVLQVTLNLIPLLDGYEVYVEKMVSLLRQEKVKEEEYFLYVFPMLVWLDPLIPFRRIAENGVALIQQIKMAREASGENAIPMILKESYIGDNLTYSTLFQAGRERVGGLMSMFKPTSLSAGVAEFFPNDKQPKVQYADFTKRSAKPK